LSSPPSATSDFTEDRLVGLSHHDVETVDRHTTLVSARGDRSLPQRRSVIVANARTVEADGRLFRSAL
jgi:hypothetical protein